LKRSPRSCAGWPPAEAWAPPSTPSVRSGSCLPSSGIGATQSRNHPLACARSADGDDPGPRPPRAAAGDRARGLASYPHSVYSLGISHYI
jgi:hypothetical protein